MTSPIPRTFADTLGALRFGTLGDELTDKLQGLTNVCATTGRAGSLTLTIKLKPGKGGQIEVFDEVKVTPPKEEKGSTLMFATPENNLSRDDPRQKSIEGLRSIEATAKDLRKIG